MADLNLGTLRGTVDLDVDAFDRKYGRVTTDLDRLARTDVPELRIDADVDNALADVDRVITATRNVPKAELVVDANVRKAIDAIDDVGEAAEQLVARPFDPKIDVDIAKAEGRIDDLKRQLLVLQRMETSPRVTADTARAEQALGSTQARLRALQGIRAEMQVTADTGQAGKALAAVESTARSLPDAEVKVSADTSSARRSIGDLGRSISEVGNTSGEDLASGIVDSLKAIPFAGAVIGIGAGIGAALLTGAVQGLAVEARSDLFSARTGLDEATAARFGAAAGEAYSNNFGTSIEGNLDAARKAIGAGLLDPDATQRDAQAVIQSLTGVSDILEEDVGRTATAAGALIRTGLVDNADQAFDAIVRGAQAGNNASEDWLDTLIEYPALFERLGLSGEEATGLISQGLQAGARNSDLVADALKEFQIRATDASEASADGFKAIGLSAEEMTAQIAAGGEGAKAGLDQVLDGLRAMEDPVARNAAGVALFGTQWEDLGDSILALDVSTAVSDLGQVAGAAQSALDTMGDNAAGQIESAQRNIEVAADGIKGALASAFGDQIEGAATFVSTNREAVIGFLTDAANKALDFGRAGVEGVAAFAEGLGGFIAGPAADMVETAGNIALAIDRMLPGDQGGKENAAYFDNLAAGMRNADEVATDLADSLREEVIENGIDPMQDKLNDVAIPAIAQAAVHDAALRLANDLAEVGLNADGTTVSLEGMTGALDLSTTTGQLLDEQLVDVAAGMRDTAEAGRDAGQSNEELTAAAQATRDELVRQLTQLGMTQEGAEQLADAYGLIPDKVVTDVQANTQEAQTAIDTFMRNVSNRVATIQVRAQLPDLNGATSGTGRMGSFDQGGYTGSVGLTQVAGIVHGQEFVTSAGPTRQYRPLLEAINAGAGPDRVIAEANAAFPWTAGGAAPGASERRYGGPATVNHTYNIGTLDTAERTLGALRDAQAEERMLAGRMGE